MTQVAGSALAAVIAALIAGKLGVYGTIIGAGVISVVATTGGPVFQHLLRRTGEGVKEQVKQQGKTTAGARPATQRTSLAQPAERTVAMPTLGRDELERTQLLRLDSPDPDGTRPLPTAAEPEPDGSYGDARTHGTRWRGWRRTLVPAVLVFVVAMGGITLYETLSGNNVSGGHGGTSIGQVLGRDSGKASTSPDDEAPDRPTDGATDSEGDGGDGPDSEDGTPGSGEQNDEAPQDEPANPDRDTDNPGRDDGTSGSDGQHGGATPKPTPTPTPTPDEGAEDDATSAGGQDGTDGGAEQPQGTERQQPRTDHAPGAE